MNDRLSSDRFAQTERMMSPGTNLVTMDSHHPFPIRDRSPMQAIQARIRRYNADIAPGSDTFRAAVLLLAGLEYGHNIDVLARRTGIERAFVAKAARRLIDNGVWQAGRTVADWAPHDEASGAFWSDVAVAEGKLCRRIAEDGSIEWAPAGYWNKSYQYVDPAAQSRLNAVYHDPGDRPAEPVPLAAERIGADEDAAPPTGAAETVDAVASEPDAPAPAAPAAAADEAPAADATEESDEEQKPPPPSLMEIFSDAVWLR